MRLKARITKSFKIYTASAGSGKTYQLTKTYLSLLLEARSPQRFRQLLAITFTNKAVGEMKQRILDNLYNFGKEATPLQSESLFSEIANTLSLSPEALKLRSRETLKKVLHNYAFFEVSTIDRFNHKLIRTFAKDLKIAQNFEVELDTDILLQEAIDLLVSDAGSNVPLTEVLLNFSLDKIEDDKSWNVTYDLYEIGKLVFQENHHRHISRLRNKSLSDFLKLQVTLRDKVDSLKQQMQQNALHVLKIIEENGLGFSDFLGEYFPKSMLKISEGDFNTNFSTVWATQFETKPLYKKNISDDIKTLLDNLHSSFLELFNSIKSASEKVSFLSNALKNTIPLALINEITKKIEILKEERNLLPISEFNTIISEEIKNQPVPYIYERLGEKYRHYFIDEFQDTSQMQWENLIPLISNALESEDENGKKGSLLLVGDAKQAIYRWRGGRAEQFLNLITLKNNPFFVKPEVKLMTSNWRSQNEIVQFNNSFFSFAAKQLKNEGYGLLYEEGNQQKTEKKELGYVEISFLEDVKTSESDPICDQVLQRILKAKQLGYRFEDICVLVRENKKGQYLADFLTHHNIPIISSDLLVLKSDHNVQFLMSFIRFLFNTNDKASLYDILSFIAPEQTAHDFIAKYLNDTEKFLHDFNVDVTQLRKASVYEITEWAIANFGLDGDSTAYLYEFLDTVFDIEKKGEKSLFDVLGYLETSLQKKTIPAPEKVNAVRIMSIHKAKGLEFPMVIFPYADSRIVDSRNQNIWIATKEDQFAGFDELLFSYGKALDSADETSRNAYQMEQEKLELDAYNVLYVALTRAINSLFIITGARTKTSASTYSSLFSDYLKHLNLFEKNQTTYSFGKFLPPGSKQKIEDIPSDIPFRYNRDHKRPSVHFSATSTSEEAINRGELFHSFMALIRDKEDFKHAITVLKDQADLSLEDEVFMKRSWMGIMEHSDLREYYNPGLQVYNEKEILHPSMGVLRPDRILLDENKAILIDYKTGRKLQKHKDQMNQYGVALSDMGFKVHKKLLLYVNENDLEVDTV